VKKQVPDVLEDGEVLVINKNKLEKELIQNGVLTFEFMKWMRNPVASFHPVAV
jgi:hypothetical protein